jgi:hypothetical protein
VMSQLSSSVRTPTDPTPAQQRAYVVRSSHDGIQYDVVS